jgi:hypothetical protein
VVRRLDRTHGDGVRDGDGSNRSARGESRPSRGSSRCQGCGRRRPCLKWPTRTRHWERCRGVRPHGVGEPYWSPAERSARFREYVEIVRGLLSSSQTPFSFEGRYYTTYEATVAPGPVQRPRPPITVGGQSPSVRRIAAECADCWNTFALGVVPFDEIVETVRAQDRELDEHCVQLDRDPATLRRSLVCWKPLDPWETPDAFERIVASFREAGFRSSTSCGRPTSASRSLRKLRRRLSP